MVCPYCRTEIESATSADEVTTCEGCNTPHHKECYAENAGCTLFGCKFAPPDEPKVQLNHQELSAAFVPQPSLAVGAHRPYTGFGDVMAASAISLARSAAAPMRAPLSAVAPPPRLNAPTVNPVAAPEASDDLASRTEQEGFITPGGIFDSVTSETGTFSARIQPRSRMVYIMLGLFFGVFGAHSFYAGYKKRAITQLCVTVLTLFYGALITAVWAIVEVCTVDRDSNQVEFR
jgi:hypothetical protein